MAFVGLPFKVIGATIKRSYEERQFVGTRVG